LKASNSKFWLIVALIAIVITMIGLTTSYMLGSNQSREERVQMVEQDAEPPSQQLEFEVDPAVLPSFKRVKADADEVGRFAKYELTIELNADYDNPYDPNQLDLTAEFIAPSGSVWPIFGFYDGMSQSWKVRFAPDEVGEWRYQLRMRDRVGLVEGEIGRFTTVPSEERGWIQIAEENKRFLAYRDGTSFYGVGVAYPWGITDFTLNTIAASGGNLITYWNGNYDSAGSGGGDDQLESIDWGIGKYDPLKAKRIDELVKSFEQRGLHMNFVIWPHDSLADKLSGWATTWDQNAYSTLGEAVDFYSSEEMWAYQEKLYRYIIARWGYSSAIGIWDLICEINGTDGWAFGDSNQANVWVEKVHNYFKANDPYGHPTMGSMAGNRADYWEFAYQTLDLADRENYYDFTYAAYAADIQKRWASFEKPLMIGETGNESDVLLYHNAIWVSLANGLASSPIWWDITKVNSEMFTQMKFFSDFVSSIDFIEERTPVRGAAARSSEGQAWAMMGEHLSYGWMIADSGNAGGTMIDFPGWRDGEYEITWYDTWQGNVAGKTKAAAAHGMLTLESPLTTQADLAFTIQ
jgi:hypothetical protein